MIHLQLDKSKHRIFFKNKNRKAAKVNDLQKLSQKLCKSLNSLGVWEKNCTVASYRSIGGELSPVYFENSPNLSCSFVFPRQLGSKMDFAYPTEWEKAPWGRKGVQPSPFSKHCSLSQIDVFLVPALVFDTRGYRLGRGLAFYDRLLSKASGLKVGVAASYQITTQLLPVGDHDIPMDVVCTDSGYFIPKHSCLADEGGISRND